MHISLSCPVAVSKFRVGPAYRFQLFTLQSRPYHSSNVECGFKFTAYPPMHSTCSRAVSPLQAWAVHNLRAFLLSSKSFVVVPPVTRLRLLNPICSRVSCLFHHPKITAKTFPARLFHGELGSSWARKRCFVLSLRLGT